MDLCALLQTMKLDERQVSGHMGQGEVDADVSLRKEWGNASDSRSCPKAEIHPNDGMMVEDPNYQVR